MSTTPTPFDNIQAAPVSKQVPTPFDNIAPVQATPQPATEAIDPSTISTGGEGSNTDQQLMSEESQRDATKKGLIIGGTGAAAIGGLAAGPLIAAGTAGPALVDAAGEPIIHATKTMLQKFGENYPELTKLATKLGFQTGAAGSTVAAWELLKHITGKK